MKTPAARFTAQLNRDQPPGGPRGYVQTWIVSLCFPPPNATSRAINAERLRALQAPLKQRYREQPTEALVTLTPAGRVDGSTLTCRVETGRALVEAGLHPATGGSGLQVCSGDMLLQALVACAAVTLRAVATALDIPIQGGAVQAEGDLDFRGTLGVSKEVPVGFQRMMKPLSQGSRG